MNNLFSLPILLSHFVLSTWSALWLTDPLEDLPSSPHCQIALDLPFLVLQLKVISALLNPQFSSAQFSSVAQSCPTLCNPINRSAPGLPVHHQLPEFTQTHVHQVSDAIQPSHPRSSPSPPAPDPSIRVFSSESTLLMRWPKYWSFSFSIRPSNEHPGLISFRMDWLDLLGVQGTLKVFSNTTVQNHQSIPQSINTTVKSINQSKKKMMFYLQYHD